MIQQNKRLQRRTRSGVLAMVNQPLVPAEPQRSLAGSFHSMGNQRQVRQVLPTSQLGVAIPIRDGCAGAIADILAQYKTGHFYTYVAAPNDDYTIPNMDFGDTPLCRSRVPRFIIQSGGKMWCGYEAFCQHINSVAKYLGDTVFLVGDEEDYIDQFSIQDGKLKYERVHTGFWRPVDEYIRERFPQVQA